MFFNIFYFDALPCFVDKNNNVSDNSNKKHFKALSAPTHLNQLIKLTYYFIGVFKLLNIFSPHFDKIK